MTPVEFLEVKFNVLLGDVAMELPDAEYRQELRSMRAKVTAILDALEQEDEDDA